jgi:poly-gamma-glutamate capsule biosynthesis protein CapA/YwtB (metallophosphatase superfamily)
MWRALSLAALAFTGVACTSAVGEPSRTAAPDSTAVAAASSTPASPTTASPTTTTTTTTSVPEPTARTITLAFSGDVLVHSPIWLQAQRWALEANLEGYDFSPFFALTRPLVESVDLAVCHLEVPLRRPGREPSTHPIYGAPAEVIAGIASGGYDHCSTASNHTLDQGTEGIDLTVAEFERVGITQSGMARTPDEIEPRLQTVTGATGPVTISLLSYTFSYNGLQPPQGQAWRSALIEPTRIIADAGLARERGAEVVIVSLHWGAEKVHAITREQRRWAEQITASGLVDVIVGHHAHVVQPIEQINGVWVVFGLGNVLSTLPSTDEWPAASQDAMIVTLNATVHLDGSRHISTPVVHPTWVDKADQHLIRNVLAELADPSIPSGRRADLEASLARTSNIVGEFLPVP